MKELTLNVGKNIDSSVDGRNQLDTLEGEEIAKCNVRHVAES